MKRFLAAIFISMMTLAFICTNAYADKGDKGDRDRDKASERDRGHDRGKTHVGFGFGLNFFTSPRPSAVYVPVPPPAVVEIRRVWVPPVYEERITKVFVQDGTRAQVRTEIGPEGEARQVTVMVPYGHYEEQVQRVLVREGYYVDQQVVVQPAVVQPVVVVPQPRGPSTSFRIGVTVRK